MTKSTTSASRQRTMARMLVQNAGGRKYFGVFVADKSRADEVASRSSTSGTVEDGDGATEVTSWSSAGNPDDVGTSVVSADVDCTLEEVVTSTLFDGDVDETGKVKFTADELRTSRDNVT